MRRVVLLVGVLALVVVLAAVWVVIPSCSDSAGTSKPDGQLPPPPTARVAGDFAFDFGPINIDAGEQKLEHTFIVRNADDHVLKFALEATSCFCVSGELKKSELAPGESMEVPVTLRLSSPGTNIQKVYLNANGALVTLQIAATGVKTDAQPGAAATPAND